MSLHEFFSDPGVPHSLNSHLLQMLHGNDSRISALYYLFVVNLLERFSIGFEIRTC
uniref:Uncharacterized protein n=1 Tax=Populus trichocarpa TaxID=3694 RepID=A0A3N7G8M7_POPTR